MATTQTNNVDVNALTAACKVITGLGTISYAFLTEPRPSEDGKAPKYSTSFLIPKSDIKTLGKIRDAINAAAQLGKIDKWNGKIPDPLKHPLRDGDAEAEEKGQEYEGHYFLNASSIRKPRIVNFQIQDILDPDEIYSGCKCRLSLSFYPFNTNGNKGIACGLNNVQKIEDGEPMGGVRSKAEDDFADCSDLDLSFDEPGTTPAASSKPAAAAKKGDDILSGIDFGNVA